ncbi:hypothetical protein COCON_G00028820 [Conger conger]|uniref:Uncharacterized protein n=1 Tax=Conger conger TaxID=82655 RepID=A0A9Q1DYB2_CONCO|nr:hypothetical protein COCON_G00028820 [Conger conger]
MLDMGLIEESPGKKGGMVKPKAPRLYSDGGDVSVENSNLKDRNEDVIRSYLAINETSGLYRKCQQHVDLA